MFREWLHAQWFRLRSLAKRRRLDRDLDEELQFHLAMHQQKLVEQGMPPEEARYAARRAFGNPTQTKEATRDLWVFPFLETLAQDLRYGLRQLRRNPGFAVLAVITMALGIGLNTVIFSIVNGLLFRPLPVSHPEQIYTLSAAKNGRSVGNVFSYQDLLKIREQTTAVFSNVAAVRMFSRTGLSVNGKSEPMWTDFVTGNFFNMMGVRPAVGRFILPHEGRVAGVGPVVVLAYSFWKSHFGGDASVVGRKATVNGRPVTIVGVAPRGFRPVSSFFDTQGYMPLGMAVVGSRMESNFLSDRQTKNLVLIARVRPGVSNNAIQAACALAAKRLAAGYPKADDWTTLHAFPLPPTGPTSSPDPSLAVVSALFLTLASVVLLVACLNVTNILLARGNARRGEIAVRAALGATRGRLTRQLLVETILLALFGCAGAIVIGSAGNRLLSSLSLHTSMPIVLDFHFDWRVFVYAFAIALLAGAVAGIAPALRAPGGDLNEALHGGARTTTVTGHRFSKVLVVSQIAGSLALLIVAGLFVRSLLKAEHSDLGFNPHHVMNVTLDPRLAGCSQAEAFQFLGRLLQRLRGLPGVQSASLAATVPMGPVQMGDSIELGEPKASQGQEAPSAGYNVVSPGYFETMQISLLRGRAVRETDNESSTRIAVINQGMAERFWPGENPIGRRFALKSDRNHPLEVVGVVKNSRTDNLYFPAGPHFYMALAQNRMLPVTLQVRTMGDSASKSQAIGGLIRSMEPAMPLEEVQTMTQALDTPNGLFLFKLGAGLAAFMGILGLILAIIGVYGVVSYTAAQRTHEIGIRLALGARPGEVLKMVLRQGMLIVAVGCVAGIFVAIGLAQLAGHFLVGVSPTDPLTFIAVSLILLAVALAACYIPARRAAKVDPMVALRYE
jgi:putative ABC transport system permease protein